LAIQEENNYYPFGLKQTGYNNVVVASNYKYKYNGKELQDELQLNVYDMEARNYMPDIGRWGNIDELAESFPPLSPYNFANNNPVVFSDPSGLSPEGIDGFSSNDPDKGPHYFTSTVVNSQGKIIDHKDDGDDNIYLNKRGGEIVGKERVGVKYVKDKKIVQDDLTGNHFLFSDGIGRVEKMKPVKPTYGVVLVVPAEAVLAEGLELLVELAEGATIFDSFAQRGNNNGKLQDDELEAIQARKAAGTASSSDLQKLKKHEKNTGNRSSRQSKDKKR
ncbi:RHS repeat domain-containing protein, partial [Flavobacterium sp. CF136]|uniref:RHS repeat domain-containing protein n=1 Tax=Flavobacterium sp. (strain CF136) TaxID=1144313 RepID=UPI000271C1E5